MEFVVNNRPEMEAAFCSAERTTLAGSMMPSLNMSTYLPVRASKPVALPFSRTFSTLVKSGVPILGAMEIVSETSGNLVITNVVEEAKNNVRNGEALSEPFSRSSVFPPMVTKMMAIGERAGALDALLEKIAEFYDQQVESEVKGLTSMIEPIMIAVMGVIVGGIVLAVFLPIFKLQEKLAGG